MAEIGRSLECPHKDNIQHRGQRLMIRLQKNQIKSIKVASFHVRFSSNTPSNIFVLSGSVVSMCVRLGHQNFTLKSRHT